MRISASSAQRVELCPSSAALASVEHESEDADKGSAGHEHLADRVRLGVDDAVERLGEVLARWNVSSREAVFLRSRLMKFEWSPRPGTITEIRLALLPDGSVQRVPERERYRAEAVLTGQFDLLWAEPAPLILDPETGVPRCPPESVLWVADAKFGTDAWVPTVESNLQTAIYAVLAARWTGATRVLPAIVFPGPGQGDWDVPERPWGTRELEGVLARVASTVERARAARDALARGDALEFVEGRHCQYCPAQGRCPAKVAMLRSAIQADGAVLPVPWGPGALEPEEAALLAKSLGTLEIFAKRARHALEVYVDAHGPIELDDGLVWGRRAEEKRKIVPAIALPILMDELGEHANAALDLTGASIERAVKQKLESEGTTRGVSATVRRLYALIGEQGGLLTEPSSKLCVHRPGPDTGSGPTTVKTGEGIVAASELAAANDRSSAGPAPAADGTIRFRKRRKAR